MPNALKREVAYQMKTLWTYVIIQALIDLVDEPTRIKDTTKHTRIKLARDQAKWWFFESRRRDENSLRWVCDHLGLDIQAVRARARSFSRRDAERYKVKMLNNRLSKPTGYERVTI